jgi:hypothetical protein
MDVTVSVTEQVPEGGLDREPVGKGISDATNI